MAALLTTFFFLLTISLSSQAGEGSRGGGGGLPITKKNHVRWPWNDYSTAIYWGRRGKELEVTLKDICKEYGSSDIVLISGLV